MIVLWHILLFMSVTLSDTAFDTLRGGITSGRWRPGSSLPSEGRLAEELAVSRTTLRIALRRLEDRGLVRSRQGSGRVVTSSNGKAVGMMAKTIGLVTNMTGHPSSYARGPFESAIDAGVYDGVRLAGLHLLNLNIPEGGIPDEEVEMVLHNPPRGLILTRPELAGPNLTRHLSTLRDAGVTLVIHGDPPGGAHFDRVISDHARGSADLTRFLLGRGCQRILRVWGVDTQPYWIKFRDQGHEQAMREAGLEPLPALVVRSASPCTPDPETFQTRTRQFAGFLLEHLRGPNRPQALIATNDPDAIVTAAACRLLGVDPEKDITIVGYDANWATVKEYEYAPFVPAATVDKINENTGRKLVETLLARLDNQLNPEPVLAMSQPTLTVPEAQPSAR